MGIYEKGLKFFGLKKRSALNSRNFFEYFFAVVAADQYANAEKSLLIFALVFCAFFNPKFYFILIPVVIYYVYDKNELIFQKKRYFNTKKIIHFVKSRHNQSLKEELAFNPYIVKELYKNKNLLFWCNYYKNEEAHQIILAELKKLSDDA